jgi:ABC-type uncharacterized transport system permease subunit
MQVVADFFPFKYYLYAPAKFFTTGDLQFFIGYFPMQIGRLILLSCIVRFIYARAVRRLEINGG